MKSRQPGQKHEKHQISTNHLGFFGSRNNGAKSYPQRRRRYVDTQNSQQTDQEGAGKIEKPKRKGNLLWGQECKTDKSRVDVKFEFDETWKKPDFWKILAGED